MTANTAAYPQPVQFELFRRLIPALKTACQLHARFEQLRDTIKYQSAVMDNGIYRYGWWIMAVKFSTPARMPNATCAPTPASPGIAGGDTLCLDTDSKKLKRAIEQATRTAEPPKQGCAIPPGVSRNRSS
ncbi:LuxR family transcriptional regulator [Klebsiella variicola]|nr:LuxR family transcriptional regulator [Klebsiella variicola]